jgi:hypothetical protein
MKRQRYEKGELPAAKEACEAASIHDRTGISVKPGTFCGRNHK